MTLEAAGGGGNQVIVNSAGSGTDAVDINATNGGVDISANTVTIDTTSTTAITGGTTTTITATTGDLTLEATAESVNIKTGTNKPIEINGAAGAVGSVLTSMGSSLRPIWSMETTVPIGGIMMWTGAAAPTNWQICDGLTFVQTDYPTLFTRLGNSNTRPNMKGLFVRGYESGVTSAVGGTGGVANNKIGTTHLPSHSHAITDPGHDHGGNTGNTNTAHTHTLGKTQGIGTAVFGAAQTDSTWPTGGVQGQESTSSAGGNHLHSITSGTTGITLGNTGGGNPYTPGHFVVYYIIYAGPVGA